MNWLALIDKISSSETLIRTFAPAADEEIRDAEYKLGIKFPNDLVEFLKESNGLLELMKNPKTMNIYQFIISFGQQSK